MPPTPQGEVAGRCPMTISEAFNLYIDRKIRDPGLSYCTEDNYKQAYRSIQKVLGDAPITSISYDNVRKWSIWMESQGFAKGTIRGYKSKLKNVLKYTNKQKITDFDLDLIELPKLGRPLPRYLTAEEAKKLLDAAESDRDRAILSLFWYTGIRVGELVGLNRRDIRGNILSVQGKGSKEREIPINSIAIERLNTYLDQRVDGLKPMFVTAKKCRIGKTTVQHMVKMAGEKAEIDKPVSCHVLRHSFGTDLHSNGLDIRIVQHFMGHADISTTQIYTHIVDNKARAMMETCQTVI